MDTSLSAALARPYVSSCPGNRFGSRVRFQSQASEPPELPLAIASHQQHEADVKAYAAALRTAWQSFPKALKDVVAKAPLEPVRVARTMDDIRQAFPEFAGFPKSHSDGPCKFFAPPGMDAYILMPMTTYYRDLNRQLRPYVMSPAEGAMTFTEEACHIFDDLARSPDGRLRLDGQNQPADSISKMPAFLAAWRADVDEVQRRAPQIDRVILDRAIKEPREAFAKRMACVVADSAGTPPAPWTLQDSRKAERRLIDNPNQVFVPDMHFSVEHFCLIRHWLPRTGRVIEDILKQQP